MVRWQPDAKGRLGRAALELYTERGFEPTTVTDIAARAGVTERTFFRYFADKREVLFDGATELQERIVAGICAAPAAAPPMEAVRAGLEGAAPVFDGRREFARQRGAAIAANPSLLERELLKLSALAAATATALIDRGVDPVTARLAAETGVGIFRVAFELWTATDPPDEELAACIRLAFARFAALDVRA